MKRNLYPKTGFIVLFFLQFSMLNPIAAQDCGGLTATYTSSESRCTATGTLQIHASGGSGTYNYQVTGTTNTDFTSSDLITGLPPGTYSATVKDIVTGCTYEIDHIAISGSYSDPRFGITETDVTCTNGNDGVVSVNALENGRGPFSYSLVAPSAMGIGTTNSTGTFTGLIPGSYSVQMTDSCGGIQTRNISVQNYTWSLVSAPVSLVSCTNYQAVINLSDSKGNSNASGTAFNGFQYGVVNSVGDTSWFASSGFSFDPGQKRTVTLLAKDRCGNVQFKNWTNSSIPSVAASVTLSSPTCSGFNAAVTGQQNLSNPTYCLFDHSGNPVSGQPCNSTGSFTNLAYGSYSIRISNTCYDTVITRSFTKARAVPSVSATVSLSNYTCTTVEAKLTGTNLTNPQFCLFDNLGNAVGACNTDGVFPDVPYGSYSVKVTDGCTGTVFTVPFSAVKKIRSVAAAITANGYTCSSFNASITGQANLTSPQYCLMDNLGNPVAGIPCNTSGIFNNLPYGAYCVHITDGCGDTSMQRCVTVIKPPAVTSGTAVVSNKTCTGFDVKVTGQANMFSGGLYCLQDKNGNPVAGVPCNASGIFTQVPYGDYCIKITDACSGNVLTDCFSVAAPIPAIGAVVISNTGCAGFTATVSGQQNLNNPSFCLYDKLNNQIGSCNSTGKFDVSGFGDYSIQTTDGCTGKVFHSPFSVTKPVASVDAAVQISNLVCSSFSASIQGQSNLAGAVYSLKDNTGSLIHANTTGVFNSLPYGSYCIEVQSACMDTIITRCFTEAAATAMTVTVTPSCTYQASNIQVKVTSGFPPYVVTVYDSLNTLIKTASSASSQINISGVPAVVPGQKYRVVVSGACGTPATQYVRANASELTHAYTITPKCPSSISPAGSSNLEIAATTNLGTMNLSITQKNFVPVSIGYSTRSGNHFTFSNLDNAVYVITYSFTGCSTTIRDTVTLPTYTFPNLARSAAYQCDNNTFSVGASVSGGISPFTYQIIGSAPSTPDINSAPQADPVFTISNGVQYSLVRLRATDACGNAGLNDVSILPLANTMVTANSNCVYQHITLSTDALPNASYTWYKKVNAAATDSVLVGTGPTYNVPYLTPADTGIYVNRMSINSGCLTKVSYFHLDGMCGGLWVLPQAVTLKGYSLGETAARLTWIAPVNTNGITYKVERKNEGAGFKQIGQVQGSAQSDSYSFVDNNLESGSAFYRLKIVGADNQSTYSNTIQINTHPDDRISVYPNPAKKVLSIDIRASRSQQYQLIIYNIAGQILYTGEPVSIQSSTLVYYRDASIAPGLYFLKVKNLSSGESRLFKVMFGER